MKSEFLRKNRQINLEYMRFTGHRYQATVAPTEAEIADYAAKNEAKLREAYDQKKMVYEKSPPQRRLRQILVKLSADAKSADDKAAQAKADALLVKLKKGAAATGKAGLTFAELATQSSEDAATKGRGGDLGWRVKGATNLSGEAEEKVFAAKPGALVGPLKGNDGYVITKVEGAREGDLPFDKVKLELAEEKLREEQANAKAKSEATAAVTKAKGSPTVALKTTFPSRVRGGRRRGRRRRRPHPARRRDRPVRAARDPGRGDHRGDWRLERHRKGGVRADPGRPRRRPVRAQRHLHRRPAQGQEGSGHGGVRKTPRGFGQRVPADEVGARDHGLDARALHGGEGGAADHGEPRGAPLRGQPRTDRLRTLRRPPSVRRLAPRPLA